MAACNISPLPADPRVQEIADKVKGKLEELAGQKFAMYKAIDYMVTPTVPKIEPIQITQFFFIKVQTGPSQSYHILVEVKVDGSVTIVVYFADRDISLPLPPCHFPFLSGGGPICF